MKKILTFVMSFMFMFILATPSFAGVTIESWESYFPKPSGQYDKYIFFQQINGSVIAGQFTSTEYFEIDAYLTDSGSDYSTLTYTLLTDNPISYRAYIRRSNGTGWDAGSLVTLNKGDIKNVQIQYLFDSTVDIRESKDSENLFFPIPPELPEEKSLVEIMAEEMPNFQNKTAGTMKILTVCGVGLIALLVALNLFGKVLRNFQVK